MKKALIYWFTFLFILLWMTSCSVRKVETAIVKKEVVTSLNQLEKNNAELKETNNTKVEEETTETEELISERKTYRPIDASMPSTFIDGKGEKKELNNVSYVEEKTTVKKQKQQQNQSEQSKEKSITDKGITQKKETTKTEDKSKAKNTKRNSFNFWFLLLVLVPFVLFYYRRNKEKIWWF